MGTSLYNCDIITYNWDVIPQFPVHYSLWRRPRLLCIVHRSICGLNWDSKIQNDGQKLIGSNWKNSAISRSQIAITIIEGWPPNYQLHVHVAILFHVNFGTDLPDHSIRWNDFIIHWLNREEQNISAEEYSENSKVHVYIVYTLLNLQPILYPVVSTDPSSVCSTLTSVMVTSPSVTCSSTLHQSGDYDKKRSS